MSLKPSAPGQQLAGRYVMFDQIAAGGMATVHYGRLLGPVGFSRTVAIKRLHPALASDPDFVAIFLDEARLAARVRHPNVVSVLDVVSEGGELLLVMEYVHGETLSRLLRAARRREERMPLPVASAILCGVLAGLHAAHEATSESGEPLGIVHRDVSPQNVLVGADGAPHLVDFGIAKAAGRAQTTREGQLKGKLPYMAIEQLRGQPVSRRTDVYAASAVLWEVLTGERLYQGDDAVVFGAVVAGTPRRPSEIVSDIPAEVEELVMRGLSTDPDARFATAREIARALERVIRPATPSEVGAWVERVAADVLDERSRRLTEIESRTDGTSAPPQSPAEPGSVTQVSSISVSRSHDERTRRRRPLLLWAGVAVLASVAVGVTLFVVSKRSEPSLSTAEPTRSIESPAPPAASAPAEASAVPATSVPSSTSAKASPRRGAPRTPKPAPRCKYLGSDGIWHIRPECL